MKMENELISFLSVTTNKEQAQRVNEIFPLVDFEHRIHFCEHQLILVNKGSSFRQILALLRGDMIANSGRIQLNRKELDQLSIAERTKTLHEVIGFIDFKENLIPYLTILENVYAGFWNLPNNLQDYRTYIQALLNWFHLETVKNAFPADCSPSQCTDLLFLRAFVHQPKLVVGCLTLDVTSQSIFRIIQLAKTTQTALMLFMQMDENGERRTLFNNQMERGTIQRISEVQHDSIG